MTDPEFVEAIEACLLPGSEFTHRNHIRLAWLYLAQYAPDVADQRIAQTIQRYATSLGAAKKYNHELTLSWMRRVERAMGATPAQDFDTFIAAHSDLLSSRRNESMTGTTGLHNLHVECIVGIHPHERAHAQSVFVDVEMDSDFGSAAASDVIEDAIDYTAVATLVTTLLQERKFQLLESMIEEVATLLLGHDRRITAVRLEIRKPAAVPAAADSFVRIARVRRA